MDAGWVKTFDEYYYGTKTSVSTANVQLIYHSVLSELLHDKRRKFTFSETAYFWRWWKEQRPTTRATFRTLVQEGRVEFAGGGWVNDFISQIERQAKYYDHDNIMVTMGGDFTYQSAANWFMNMDKLINHVNTHPANLSDINIFYSTPSCYLKAIYLYGRRDKAMYTEKVVKQLTVIARLGDSYELHLLRHAVSLVLHHDAITDEEVEYQLVPLPAAVINLPGRSSTAIQELCFEAENIPPLGFTAYYIAPNGPRQGGGEFVHDKYHQQWRVLHRLQLSANDEENLLE
ncbi:hypothetical protein HF086_011036 [Spodoptera exigua]|uniref:Uncharacterized protein n=1 Tax=Spodoptera exigua TaxID=7107 RepID=A0A922SMI4_SPOEX|nr:hypothetical protein HF086_011036 [Spodoptera exigua]